MKTSYVSLLTGFLVFSAPVLAWARVENNTKARCANDQLNAFSELAGRNAWAHKCGYIDAEDREYLNRRERYVVFSDFDHPPVSPISPCVDGLHILSFCVLAGCFPPDQEIMFSGEYHAIGFAGAEVHTPTISVPSSSWLVGDELEATAEEPIDYFVVGDERGKVLTFVTENARTLTVTLTHPMVMSNGDVLGFPRFDGRFFYAA